MPFTKIGRNEYQSPSGRTFTKKQVGLYYAGGGHFPGQKGMSDQFPPNHNSPTAPGAAAKPSFVNSGAVNAATSPTPTSVLSGGKQTFGPLAYSTQDQDQEYWSPDRTANREISRSRRDFNRRK
jgi:hypothetical protein